FPSSRTGDLVADPCEAFVPAEKRQHVENSGRGGLPRKRRAKRLRKLAETEAQLFRIGLEVSLQRLGGPVRFRFETRGNLPQKRLRVTVQQASRLVVQRQRARLEKERRAVGQLEDVAGAGLEYRHRRGQQLFVRRRAKPFGDQPGQ